MTISVSSGERPIYFTGIMAKEVRPGYVTLGEAEGGQSPFGRTFSGEVVLEIGREDLREVLQGNYRIIYRLADGRVDILAVFHRARIFDERDLASGE